MLPTIFFNNDYPVIFESFFDSLPFFTNRETIPLNIKETDKSYRFEFSLPGQKKEDISLDIQDKHLRITVEKKEEKQQKEEYSYQEFKSVSSFERILKLPENVETGKVDASYEGGILIVSIPKKEKNKTKKIIKIK